MSRRPIDLKMQRFGRLIVVNFIGIKGNYARWECECDCGSHVSVSSKNLRTGKTKSCGCLKQEMDREKARRMREKRVLDLSNRVFGKLTVIKKTGTNRNRSIVWKCLCTCGNIHLVTTQLLMSGGVKSCGCLKYGENNTSWKGGITPENIRVRTSAEYEKWRSLVFQRDSYTCIKCEDSLGGNLNAHHMYNFAEFVSLRMEVSNGITMCESCHEKFHGTFGYTNNNPSQVVDFVLFH